MLKELVVTSEFALASVSPESALWVCVVNLKRNAEVVNVQSAERVGNKLELRIAAHMTKFERLEAFDE